MKPTLFYFLTGQDPNAKRPPGGVVRTPETVSCIFLEKSHVVEYILVGPEKKRLVSLFFGPGEFAIPCHPEYSHLEALDDGTTTEFTYSIIFQALRRFPASWTQYREIKRNYLEKVEKRIQSLQTMSVEERYEQLKAEQPWVFKLAEKEDIASYLGIPVTMLAALSK